MKPLKIKLILKGIIFFMFPAVLVYDFHISITSVYILLSGLFKFGKLSTSSRLAIDVWLEARKSAFVVSAEI